MDKDKKVYATWYGHELTKLEYLLIKEYIICDIMVEEDLPKSNMADAKQLINRIKNLQLGNKIQGIINIVKIFDSASTIVDIKNNKTTNTVIVQQIKC